MKQFSIRQYVAMLTLIPLLVIVSILEIFFVQERFSDMDDDVLERGKLISRQLATSSEYGVFSTNMEFLKNIAQGVLQQPDVRGLVILNLDSESLVEAGEFSSTPENGSSKSTPLPSILSNKHGQASISTFRQLVNPLRPVRRSKESLWIYHPIVSAQVPLDELASSPVVQYAGSVIVEMSLERTNNLKVRLLWITLGSTLLLLLMSLFLVHLASRGITNPIRKLSLAMQKIGQGELDTRTSISSQVSELNTLADGINDMVEMLHQENLLLHDRIEEATRIAAIAFDSHEGMMVTDAEGRILRVNNAFTKITGYTAEESIGQMAGMLKSGRHDAEFYASMWRYIHQIGSWQGEIWNQRKNGEMYPAWLTITAIQQADGVVTYYVATLSDITSRVAAEQEIKFMAFYDTLTQLPNRRMLMDRLGQAIAVAKRSGRYGALMFLDLDNFKTLNDKYGHAVGDFILIEASRRIVSCVREMDTVARFGGDEFVVMLGELDKDQVESMSQASIVAEKIRVILSEPYELPLQPGDAGASVQHYCTSSIGVTLFANDEDSVEELLEWSDRAMYRAKRDGRNLIRFNS